MQNKSFITKIIPCCLLVFLLLTFGKNINAQNNSVKKQEPEISIHLKVYYQSIMLGDANMAINALHYLIASDPEKYGNWQDTLAVLYLRNNAFQQAHLLSSGLLNARGYTDLRMEIKAISAKGLQQPAEAIDAYSMLYSKTGKAAYGFEELRLQYSIKRLAETVTTATDLLQKISVADKDFVTVVKADGKTAQQVSLHAAVCNILGLAYIDLKDRTNAIAQFEVALKENPDFDLAKNNLVIAQSIADNAKK